MLGVVDDFLTGMDNGGEIGFPIFNKFLSVLDGVLGLVPKHLAFLDEELPRFLPGLGCIQQRDASANKNADGEDGEAAPLW